MKCLYCWKELNDKSSNIESISKWHKSCIKHFFDVDNLPEISIRSIKKEISMHFNNNKISIAGVQKKFLLNTNEYSKKQYHLTLANYPVRYILKPKSDEYECLPESEYLVMLMAKHTGINTVQFGLIQTSDTKEYCYITKRIDRTKEGNKYSMEDFCQLSMRLTEDKYKGSYEKCGKIIKQYSINPGLDITELFLRIVFSFVTGNSDMHLKNFSLIEDKIGSGLYKLSPAYDMLPVNVIIPNDKDQMALTLNDKNRNLRRNDFLILSENLSLDKKIANKLIGKVISLKDKYLELCEESLLTNDFKKRFSNLLIQIINALIKINETN